MVSHFNLQKMQKYLGIQISDDLAWSKHINQMTTKSNNTLKFIKRNIQTNIHKIKETAYKTYVRPLLEYSATVWDPWQKKYINQIEMVQHRAVRYIFNDYNFTSSVSSMLNQLALPTLEKRRKIASLSMFYKINHGLVRIKFPDYIKPTLQNRFSIPYSRIDAHRHSFFPRTQDYMERPTPTWSTVQPWKHSELELINISTKAFTTPIIHHHHYHHHHHHSRIISSTT